MDISSLSINVYLAIIPSILLCLFVYHMDVVEKEPIRLLLILFFVGVLITVPARFFIKMLMSVTGLQSIYISDCFFLSYFIIALVEEGYKFLVLIISCWKNKEFNYKYDAIVYSVFISLGFATLENILYVQDFGFFVALQRAVLSVPGHAFYAIASGFFLGLAKENSKNHNRGKTILFLLLAIVIPIVLHGTFDFLLLIENDLVFGIFLSFVATLYFVSYFEITKINKVNKRIDN